MDVRQAMQRAVEEDSILTGFLEDRIFDRPVSRKGPRPTPEAFSDSQTQPILPCVSISDAGTSPDPLGDPMAFITTVTLWYRVPDSEDGEGVLREMVDRSVEMFHGGMVSLGVEEGNRGAMLELVDRFGSPVDPFVERCRFTYLRFRGWEVR